MEFDGQVTAIGIPLKIFLVDLLLSGDNAVLIAMACRSLPPEVMRRAVLYGTLAAIVLRFLLATVVSALLLVPLLKLAGGAALLIIAIKLILGDEETGGDGEAVAGELWAAVRIIVIADVVMSLDNVVAIAAVAQNHFGYLALGLVLSVPLLIYGSLFVSQLLKRYPILITGGGALLAWIAGDLAVSDPVVSGWVDSQAFALHLSVPFAATVFALLHSRNLAERRSNAPRHPPSAPKDVFGLSITRLIGGLAPPAPPEPVEPAKPVKAKPAKAKAAAAPPPPLIHEAPVEPAPEPAPSVPVSPMVVFFLIAGPLVFLALFAFWVWSSTMSDF